MMGAYWRQLANTIERTKYFDQFLYLGDETASQKPVNRFMSSKRSDLSHMFCLISTPSVGYLYSIGGDTFHLVSTYHYAAAVTQVS